MLLNWFYNYLIGAVFCAICFLIFKKKLGKCFLIGMLLIWLPLAIFLFFVVILLVFEAFRSWKLDGYEPSEEIEFGINEFFYKNNNNVFEVYENQICIGSSYDMRKIIDEGLFPITSKLDVADYPTEDGLWYAFFLSGEKISRVYIFSPRDLKLGCYKKE